MPALEPTAAPAAPAPQASPAPPKVEPKKQPTPPAKKPAEGAKPGEKKAPPKKHTVDPAPKKAADKGGKKEPAERKSATYNDPDREAARKLDLRLSQYKVLQYLAKSGDKTPPRTYNDIKEATGYYQSLTADLRAGKEGSLCDKGFAKEFTTNVDGKERVAFGITAKGRQAVAKSK